MHIEERIEFIDALSALPIIETPSIRGFFDQPDTPPHDPGKATGSVMPNTINAFFPGVDQDTCDDVNLCKLVMQNAATKMFPKEEQLFEWYKYYVNGLSNLGWVIQNKNIQEVTIKRTGLTMDQIALEVATGLIGANAAGILAKVSKQALEEVKKNPGAIQLFESDKKLGTQAKFDMAPVWADNNGQANMVLNCISLDARESTQGILFWKSTKSSTTIKTGAVRTYLDKRIFAGLRGTLYQKYSAAGDKFIKDLPDF